MLKNNGWKKFNSSLSCCSVKNISIVNAGNILIMQVMKTRLIFFSSILKHTTGKTFDVLQTTVVLKMFSKSMQEKFCLLQPMRPELMLLSWVMLKKNNRKRLMLLQSVVVQKIFPQSKQETFCLLQTLKPLLILLPQQVEEYDWKTLPLLQAVVAAKMFQTVDAIVLILAAVKQRCSSALLKKIAEKQTQTAPEKERTGHGWGKPLPGPDARGCS